MRSESAGTVGDGPIPGTILRVVSGTILRVVPGAILRANTRVDRMDGLFPAGSTLQGVPYVTTITLESGDRHRLEKTVTEIKETATRKGVELKGPHPSPPEEHRVPQSKTLGPDGGRFEAWTYTVYARTVEIVGHEEFARSVAGESYPDCIHLSVDVNQRQSVGGR